MSLDRNQVYLLLQERSIGGVGDGVVEGGAALGKGFYRGFTGLVSKPIEGAKSKGVGGMLGYSQVV